MATNEIFKHGQYLDYEVGEVRSGTPVRIGILNGVALTDSGGSKSAIDGRPSGGVGNKQDRATVAHVGAFIVPVDDIGDINAFEGAPVYWAIEDVGTGNPQLTDRLTLNTDSGIIFGAIAPTKTDKPGHLVVHVSQFLYDLVNYKLGY